jgi:hypothetical protein
MNEVELTEWAIAPGRASNRDQQAGLVDEARAVSEYRWEMPGVILVLRGAVTRDSLLALSKLVR